MTNVYKFYNTDQLNNDKLFLSEQIKQSKNINRYLTNRFNTCDQSALNEALKQPNIFINGGPGNIGCDVDKFSALRNGIVSTNVPCKLSLQERMFATVPYLGKGKFHPEIESELIHGDLLDRSKSSNTVSDKHFSTQYTPLIPEIEKTISNPANLIEQQADKNWIRGGIDTRDTYRKKTNVNEKGNEKTKQM